MAARQRCAPASQAWPSSHLSGIRPPSNAASPTSRTGRSLPPDTADPYENSSPASPQSPHSNTTDSTGVLNNDQEWLFFNPQTETQPEQGFVEVFRAVAKGDLTAKCHTHSNEPSNGAVLPAFSHLILSCRLVSTR
jgi:hypothetical protein